MAPHPMLFVGNPRGKRLPGGAGGSRSRSRFGQRGRPGRRSVLASAEHERHRGGQRSQTAGRRHAPSATRNASFWPSFWQNLWPGGHSTPP
jgi:hypothetical protein